MPQVCLGLKCSRMMNTYIKHKFMCITQAHYTFFFWGGGSHFCKKGSLWREINKCDAQSVNYFQGATESSSLSAKYSVKVKWMIPLSVARPALLTFRLILLNCLSQLEKSQTYMFPVFSPLCFFFFFIRMVVSLDCSAFMTSINGLFCPGIKSISYSHWHTTFVLCLRCLKRNKWEIAHHLGVKSSGIRLLSVTSIHYSWYHCS